MDRAFAAQLSTRADPDPVDVVVAVDDRLVSIEAGGETIGRWRRADCEFEPHGSGRFSFLAEGETLSIDVPEAGGFQQALMVVRNERRNLLPRGALLAGAGSLLVVLTVAVLLGTGGASRGTVAPESATPAPPGTAAPGAGEASAGVETDSSLPAGAVPSPTSSPAPATVTTSTPDRPPHSPDDLAVRWNAVSPSPRLEVPGSGATVLGRHLSVTLGRGTVSVAGRFGADQHRIEEVVAALGMTVAVLDPDLEPPARKDVLERLGLDLAGPNPEPLTTRSTVRGIDYRLEYVPGEKVDLTATMG